MDEKQTGLFRELIIHPCETLREMLENNNMTQKELALRTGVSEKHVSKILSGSAPISTSFAHKLEYVFGVKSSFWQKLQCDYDSEILEFEDFHSINQEEKNIVKKFKEIFSWLSSNSMFTIPYGDDFLVLEARKFFRVGNLKQIQKLTYSGAFKACTTLKIDTDILYAWEFICNLLTANVCVKEIKTYSEKKKLLIESIDKIKSLMTLPQDVFLLKLQEVFSDCGIVFCIVPFFKGAPIQGLLKKDTRGKHIICITLRQKRSDIFWFTLFHEIGHFINGDSKNGYLDFVEMMQSKSEKVADEFAEKKMLNVIDYQDFLAKADYSYHSIELFAKNQNVIPSVVIGRLQKDKIIKWNEFSDKIQKYDY